MKVRAAQRRESSWTCEWRRRLSQVFALRPLEWERCWCDYNEPTKWQTWNGFQFFSHRLHTYLIVQARSDHQQCDVRDNDQHLNDDNYREIAFLHSMNVSSVVGIESERFAFFLKMIAFYSSRRVIHHLRDSIRTFNSPVNDSIPTFVMI